MSEGKKRVKGPVRCPRCSSTDLTLKEIIGMTAYYTCKSCRYTHGRPKNVKIVAQPPQT
jgi:transposase-like protein